MSIWYFAFRLVCSSILLPAGVAALLCGVEAWRTAFHPKDGGLDRLAEVIFGLIFVACTAVVFSLIAALWLTPV